MADSLTLKKTIPPQIVNEGAKFGPLYLTEFIESLASAGKAYFRAELTDGRALPQGLICTTDGVIDGIASGQAGNYQVQVTVVNDEAEELTTEFALIIKARIQLEDPNQIFKKIKAEIWEALGKDLPLPEMTDLFARPVTAVEIYYLLQRFATLTVWDVYNLEHPAEKKLLMLEGASKHYHIYDRGCCIIAAPKELYSHERTLEDALQTARVIAREAYQRDWAIELTGFNKMIRAAWVELQLLGDRYGKPADILRYVPSPEDVIAYMAESNARQTGPAI